MVYYILLKEERLMKIIPNIPSFIKLIHCLKYLNKHKKDIENAKAAGDLEKEREYILSATSLVFFFFGQIILMSIIGSSKSLLSGLLSSQ